MHDAMKHETLVPLQGDTFAHEHGVDGDELPHDLCQVQVFVYLAGACGAA